MSDTKHRTLDELLLDVKGRLSVAETVRADSPDRVTNTSRGFMCCSPIRAERTPSFHVYEDTDTWYDFGANEGGDLFDYIGKRDGTSFVDSLKWAAERCGVPSSWGAEGSDNKKDLTELREKRLVTSALTEASWHYHQSLTKEAKAHLSAHYGLSDDTISEFRIGWGTGTLLKFLTTSGFSEETAAKTGLFIRTRQGLAELHKDRIFFPYLRAGQCVYGISRRLDGVTPNDDWQKAKYKKNLVRSDTHPYVSHHLTNACFYGENTVGKRTKTLIVTEGTTDALSAYQCGFSVLSPATTKFRSEDADRLYSLTKRFSDVVIVNDHEEPKTNGSGRTSQPGMDGSEDTGGALFMRGESVRVCVLPREPSQSKVDLNSFVHDNGAERFRDELSGSPDFISFLISRVDKGDPPKQKEAQVKKLTTFLGICGEIEREEHLKLAAKSWGVSISALRKASASHGKAEAASNGSSADVQVAPPSGPGELVGAVVASPSLYYFRLGAKGSQERVSNFVLKPQELVDIAGRECVVADILAMDGEVRSRHLFTHESWSSKRKFYENLPGGALAWGGNDENTQALLDQMRGAGVPRKRGVVQIGFHRFGARKIWAFGNEVWGDTGKIEDVRFCEPRNAFLANKAVVEEVSHAGLKKLASEALPLLLKVNEPEVMIPLLGWFFAAGFSPDLVEAVGHFPILFLHATPGSGKSHVITEILWRMYGVNADRTAFSCGDTPFALLAKMCATTSIPMFFDEFNIAKIGKRAVERMTGLLKRAYCRETVQRGRSDLSLASFRLCAPVVVAGESMPTDTALLERVVPLTLRKDALTAPRQEAYEQLRKMPLQRFYGSYARFLLSADTRSFITRAADDTARLLSSMGKTRISPRVADNVAAWMAGLLAFDAWAASLGVKVSGSGISYKDIIERVLEPVAGDKRGGSRAICDGFMEDLSGHAIAGHLYSDVHYTIVESEKKRELCIYLRPCYNVYLEQMARTRREDQTNGLRALRASFAEEMRSGGYVTSMGRRVKLGEGVPVLVSMDVDKMCSQCDIDPDAFPARSRSHGGRREQEY